MKSIYKKLEIPDDLQLDSNLIDQIHDAVIVTDLNGVIKIWNKGAEAQFGYTPDEIIGKSIYTLYPEEKHSYTSNDVIRLLQKEHRAEFEASMRRKSGEYLFVHSSLSDISDKQGNIKGIVSYTIDITKRVTIEKELEKYHDQLENLVKERTNKLEETQNILLNTNRTLKVLSQGNQVLIHAKEEQELLENICRIIVETGDYLMSFVGLAENDEEKTIRPAAHWGYDEGYIENLHITWSDTEHGRGPSGKAIRSGKPYVAKDIHNDPDFEPWRESALQHGYESCLAIPLLDGEMAFGALLIYSRYPDAFDDEEVLLLTELANNMTFGIFAIRAQKELVQKERLAVLGQLIATVSHELRNPLGTIRTSLYTIENKTSSHDVDIKQPIKRIERNIFRCDSIIDELLDYTRIRDLSLEDTNIDNWLKSELDEYTLPDTVRLKRKLSSGAVIKIEHDRFHRCLINLLNNACQAMDKNDENASKELTVESTVKSNELIIRISDTGTGIPENEVGKVFEPLYSSKIYGVGLGLPIVKQILELHGGKVKLSSKQGQGTTVMLILPIVSN